MNEYKYEFLANLGIINFFPTGLDVVEVSIPRCDEEAVGVNLYGRELFINWESLVVLGELIGFLEEGNNKSQFLHALLSRQLIEDQALAILVRGSEFDKKLYQFISQNQNLVKPTIALVTSLFHSDSKLNLLFIQTEKSIN